jgi:eukaryotic-like serine/threonine-protein kinase
MTPPDPLAGLVLEHRYTLLERIAGGRVGGVYRAADQRAEREVAVRVISAEGLDEHARTRLRASFRAEARTVVRLAHPNLVQGLDYGSDERRGLHYLVTELHPPQHLDEWLQRYGPPPLPAAMALVLQAARGLGAAHAAGLVHRGVRPGTLLVGDAGDGTVQLRVADFGRVDLDEGPGPPAPELEEGTRPTLASDVYALAVTALQVVTGLGTGPGAAPERLLADLRALPTPSPVLEVLERALSPDPRDRHADARAFGDALEAALAVAAVAPAAPSVAPRRAARPAPLPDPAPSDAGAAPPASGRPPAGNVVILAALPVVIAGAILAGILAGRDHDGSRSTTEAEGVTALAAPSADRLLAPGDNVQGHFIAADPLTERGAHHHLWLVRAPAGSLVTVTMRSDEVDPYLAWGIHLDGAWDQQGTDDDGGGGTTAVVRFPVPPGAEVGIHATTFGGRERGPYTLTLEAAPPPEPVEVAVGSTVTGILESGNALDNDGAFATLYLLRGAPGERVLVDLGSAEFDAYLHGGRMAGGVFVAEMRDDDGGPGTGARLAARLDDEGAYAVLATSLAPGGTGAYKLTVRRGPQAEAPPGP